MYSLGLLNYLGSPSPISVHKNLLCLKLNIFNFVHNLIFRRFSLAETIFPKLNYNDILSINNSKVGGPINCAADDLEYVDSNDQIEFFNNFINFQSQYPEPSEFNGNSNDLDNLTFEQLYDYSFHKQPETFIPQLPSQSHPIPIPDQMLNGSMSSHFSLNMVGLNSATYFNDFKQKSFDNQSTSSIGSSNESNVNPLDDEFFKKMNERKRKIESPDIDTFFEQQPLPQSLSSYTISTLPPPGVSQLTTQINAQQLPPQHSHSHSHPHPHPHPQPEPKERRSSTKKFKLDPTLTTTINEDGSPSLRYQCPHCQAKFKVKSYLTRHLKKHNSWKAFVCPFYQESIVDNMGNTINQGTKCHPTGGFSRRDTYKTHLKALHFIYPPGTKSNERNLIGGRCAGCFQFFENNLKWLENHIENGYCTGTVLHRKSNFIPLEQNSKLMNNCDHKVVKVKQEIID